MRIRGHGIRLFLSSLASVGPLIPFCAGFPNAARAMSRLVPQKYATIQGAIDHAANGDTVLISAGTYRGPGNHNIELRGLSIVITSCDGAEQTIMDCENLGRGFWIHSWESSAARIEKLTITNGNANGGYGGGIFCDIASPIIADCRIINNGGARYGGGLALWVYGGIVERCVIAGNHASESGGGAASMFSGGINIQECLVTGNWTDRGCGGGVSFQDDSGDFLTNCTVAANYAADCGGGVYTNETSILDRCILSGNCSAGPGRDLAAFTDAVLDCCGIDTSGVDSQYGTITYDSHCVFTDPMFCGPVACSQTTGGDWTLNGASPCLAEHSPCGQLIGAIDQGCGVVIGAGACCHALGVCQIERRDRCTSDSGLYIGDNVPCQPNPCLPSSGVPTRGETDTWGRIKAVYRDAR